MKRILLTFCCACMLLSLHAQQQTVAGRVTDASDGTPLPGVSVVVKGTARGTATDTDGRYSLSVNSTDVLVFSFIGYESQEVNVGERTTIDVSMGVSIQSLQEVVVIGYGEKSRALMTESIGTVSASDITKVPVASPDAAIQGRVSGVQVTSVDGTPGAPVAIRIRGVGTVGDTQPLFVIDGVPVG
ncbi:MAG TPA: carboxypeptidase-like regulatory domain-containing protein, partial [Ohtaekwangia sp.]|nr:carboxypeptidase-like regulatory domain-containing protein [Ohtaekwangia sp.]